MKSGVGALLGSVTGNPWLAISRVMQGSDLYMSVAPYPSYGPAREHYLVFPAEHIVARLEERIAVLETQVKALQETVDNWEQWYYQWNESIVANAPLDVWLHATQELTGG